MSVTKVFVWRGTPMKTYGDIMKAIDQIISTGKKEDAQEFMTEYRNTFPDAADSNIGYLAGYYDTDTARKIWDWFGTAHPIFGRM